jgi:hypothetical protein
MGPLGGLHAISVHETDEKSSSWTWNWSLIIQSVTVQFVHWNVVARIFINTQNTFLWKFTEQYVNDEKSMSNTSLIMYVWSYNSGLLRLMTGIEPLS